MTALLRIAGSIEYRWFELPYHARWFVGCVGTALALGVAGGLLGG